MKSKLFIVAAVLVVLAIGAAAGAGIFYLAFNTPVVFAQNGSQVPTGRDAGILVGAVTPDSPGDKAGIVRGDILLEANGKAVNQPVELNDIVNGMKAGDKLTLSVLHGDATRSVDVTLADQNGKVYLGIHPAIVIAGWGEGLFGRGMGVFRKPAVFKGALVTSVVANGPASKAGIQVGDQILSVNGKTVDASNDLAAMIQALKPGDTVTLSIQKKGASSPADSKATLEDDPNKAGTAYLGLSYRIISAANQNGLRNFGQPPLNKIPRGNQAGVLVSAVTVGSPADKAGVKSKDLITAVNGKAITTPDELSSLVKAAKTGDKMTLTITRPGETAALSIIVTLEANPDASGAPYLGVTLMALRQQPQVSPTPKASGTNF